MESIDNRKMVTIPESFIEIIKDNVITDDDINLIEIIQSYCTEHKKFGKKHECKTDDH